MHIVIAPDSFKGTLTAAEAGAAMAEGIHRVLPHTSLTIVPLADGGEGTLDILVRAGGGSYREATVSGPMGEPRRARLGLLDGGATAIVEMAEAAGLLLVPPRKRDAMQATTFGVGQLIRGAMEGGARRILVGVGGSATSDGGAGCVQALGVRFYDAQERLLPDGMGGGLLDRIARIDLEGVAPALRATEIVVLADVFNPLTGPQGAARTYAAQKGATALRIGRLEANLAHFARVIQRDLGRAVANVPGAGAAGGLAGGLIAFTGASLRSGAEGVMESVGLAQACAAADALLTGEGCFDGQSHQGKVVAAVTALGQRLKLPVFVLAGMIRGDRGALLQGLRAAGAVSAALPANSPDSARALAERAAALAPRWFSD